MAEREWKASGTAAATAPFEPVASAQPVRSAPSTAAISAGGNGHAASWDEVYRSASSGQRQELLALARSQGVIYAHQLPAPNGHKAPDDAEAISRITRLLEGRTDLPPVAPQSTSMTDERLDRMQQEAVARGLAKLTRGSAVTVNSVLPGPTLSEGVDTFVKDLARQNHQSESEAAANFVREHRPTKGNTHRVRNLERPFPQKAPAIVAKNAAPDIIEANRDDGDRASLDDLLETAMER